jgi:hypothetical protein
MGEFFGETETPAEREARDLMTEFKTLSDEARQEIRDFVQFKKLQESAETADASGAAETDGQTEEKP